MAGLVPRCAWQGDDRLCGLLEHLARDNEVLYLRRALVDLGDARITIIALGRHVTHETHTTEYLDRLVRAHRRGLRRAQLRHCGLLGEVLASIFQVRRAPVQQACLLHSARHLRQLQLNCVHRGDGGAKGLALSGVARRHVDGCLRDAEGLPSHADASAIQGCHRNLEALTNLAQKRRFGHADVLENEVGRGRCADAELVLLGPQAEARPVRRHDECAHALVLEAAVSRREDDGAAGLVRVCDPCLCAARPRGAQG
mmetsp:Transcript_16380/g.42438  ORF Transcript_16380/g.42438 Transcript_16380/m.42438 type:complete len:256 (-) Transcript_16380:626-1393(-)